MVTLRSGSRTADASLHSNGEAQTNGKSDSNFTKEKAGGSNMKYVVFGSLVLDLLGFTVILPLFPALLEYYSKHDSSGLYNYILGAVGYFQAALGVPPRFNSVLFGGFLGSVFSLLQFLSSPVTGALSDVYGRKPVLIATLLGMGGSYAVWSVSSNFAVFVLARVLGGLSKGNVSLGYSIMTDILDTKTRAMGMALIGVAFSIGFIVGPAIGVVFSKWGTSGWFAASAVYALTLTALNVLFVIVCFKETLPKSNRFKSLGSGLADAWSLINPGSLFSFRPIKGISDKERSSLVQLGLINFLFLFVYSGLEFTLTFVTHLQHRYDHMAQAYMFVYLGLVMVVIQGGYMRRVGEGKEKMVAARGIMVMVPAFPLIGWSYNNWMLYAGLTLYAVGSSLLVPCLTGLASVHGPPSQKGALLGIWRSLGALARATGPLTAAAGFWFMGSGWCYSVGGVALMLPLVLLRRWNSAATTKQD
uniref:Major facilitator superfamily domain-containing protein 10-like n=2 Tax=Hirondellea gigas TaxID=1518452 RepID=A0A6A7G3Y4_9CRUS